MAEEIPIIKTEFRLDDNNNPYIRIEIETKILQLYQDKLNGKNIVVDIIPT